MDSTENEIEGINVEGFPTLKLFAKGKKTAPIDFDGDRTILGLAEFLKKHASHPDAWTDINTEQAETTEEPEEEVEPEEEEEQETDIENDHAHDHAHDHDHDHAHDHDQDNKKKTDL
jgi:protein disulfide-isomerase A1